MGGVANIPINEAVFLLSKVAPATLKSLLTELPVISEELNPGVMAGDLELSDSDKRKILAAKARVMIVVLEKTIQLSDKALNSAGRKILFGRRTRLGGQVVTVVGTSGVLAAIGVTQNGLAIISAILALLGSLAAIVGEYFEQVVDRKQGGLNDVFLKIALARQKSNLLLQTIKAYIEVDVIDTGMESAIKEANVLCEEIVSSIYQIIESNDL